MKPNLKNLSYHLEFLTGSLVAKGNARKLPKIFLVGIPIIKGKRILIRFLDLGSGDYANVFVSEKQMKLEEYKKLVFAVNLAQSWNLLPFKDRANMTVDLRTKEGEIPKYLPVMKAVDLMRENLHARKKED